MNPTLEETIAAMLHVRDRLGSLSANSLADAMIAEHGRYYGDHGHLVEIARPLNTALYGLKLRKAGVSTADQLAKLIRPEIDQRAEDIGGNAAALKTWLDQRDREVAAGNAPDAA